MNNMRFQHHKFEYLDSKKHLSIIHMVDWEAKLSLQIAHKDKLPCHEFKHVQSLVQLILPTLQHPVGFCFRIRGLGRQVLQ